MRTIRSSLRIYALACAALTVSATSGRAGEFGSYFKYKGYSLDLSKTKAPIGSMKAALENQLDIVVQAAVPPEVAQFFRTVHICVNDNVRGENGFYNGKEADIPPMRRADNKPILLHELLHGYHHQVLKPRGLVPKLQKFYEASHQKFPYWRNEYFQSNVGEYFAVTASIYIFGLIGRPPYSRQTIRKNQPVYYQFLRSLFGPQPN